MGRYEPFNGIVLTDTFNLNKQTDEEVPSLFQLDLLPANNARAERQQDLPIQVIVGNPPWSARAEECSGRQPKRNIILHLKNALKIPTQLHSTAVTYKKSLYDTYKIGNSMGIGQD